MFVPPYLFAGKILCLPLVINIFFALDQFNVLAPVVVPPTNSMIVFLYLILIIDAIVREAAA